MPDFAAVISASDARATDDRPPACGSGGLTWARWPWGWLGIDGRLWRRLKVDSRPGAEFHLSGRATRRGSASVHPDDVVGALDGNPQAYDALSGMFLLLRAAADGLAVATDRFSHMPVYADAQPGMHGRVVVSSSVQWIAHLAHRPPELDPVSVAELLLWDNITFPHTTRCGIVQLAPGSVHFFDSRPGPRILASSRQLWEPREPDRPPSKRDCIATAAAGVEEASKEIAGSGARVGVLLSGGLDSRIIAATLCRLTHVEAITYADRPNRESAAAVRTSSVLGIRHHLIERDPEFYSYAFLEGQRLVGYEQSTVPCHSLCVADRPELAGLDAVVGGFGCDILLKGAYIPYSMMEVLRQRYLRRPGDPTDRIGKHNYGHADRRARLLRAEYVEAARERRRRYECSLRSIRPTTAEEWVGFYPISHTTSIDGMAADRRLPHDEFYFRAGLVDASTAIPWVWKKGLDIISVLGTRFARPVARLPHADTGLPATWRYLPTRIATKLSPSGPTRGTPSVGGPPWATCGSFVNYRKFFELSPTWRSIRDQALADEAAVAALEEIMQANATSLFHTYHPDGGSLMNAAVVHVLRLTRDVLTSTSIPRNLDIRVST